MRVLPQVVGAALITGVTVSLVGCSQFNAALGQRQAIVSFKSGTSSSVRLQVRAACAKVPATTPAPLPSDSASPYALQQVTYRIDKASDADVARLQECLGKFPSVSGVILQDSGDQGS
jgi:hypothetical protein